MTIKGSIMFTLRLLKRILETRTWVFATYLVFCGVLFISGVVLGIPGVDLIKIGIAFAVPFLVGLIQRFNIHYTRYIIKDFGRPSCYQTSKPAEQWDKNIWVFSVVLLSHALFLISFLIVVIMRNSIHDGAVIVLALALGGLFVVARKDLPKIVAEIHRREKAPTDPHVP